jgi:hypothetical protein
MATQPNIVFVLCDNVIFPNACSRFSRHKALGG